MEGWACLKEMRGDGRGTTQWWAEQEVVTTAGYRREGRELLDFGAVGEGWLGRFKHPKPRVQLLLARNRGINTPTSLSPPSRKSPTFWIE